MRLYTATTSLTAASLVLLLFAVELHGTNATGSGVMCPLVGPTAPAQCDGTDREWFPVSVVGRGTYCTMGPEICAAQQFAACPGPSNDLPYGAKCVQLETNVYGCMPKASCSDGELDDESIPTMEPAGSPVGSPATDSTSAACESGCAIDTTIPPLCTSDGGLNGWTAVSVVEAGTFCTNGLDVCVANNQAACPGPQQGLPFGSSCVRIPTGVFGCVENKTCQQACKNPTKETPAATSQSDGACTTASDPPQPNKPTPAPTSAGSYQTPTTSTTPTTTPTPTNAPTPTPTNAAPPTPTSAPPPPPPVMGTPTDVTDDNASLLPVPNPDDTFTLDNISNRRHLRA